MGKGITSCKRRNDVKMRQLYVVWCVALRKLEAYLRRPRTFSAEKITFLRLEALLSTRSAFLAISR